MLKCRLQDWQALIKYPIQRKARYRAGPLTFMPGYPRRRVSVIVAAYCLSPMPMWHFFRRSQNALGKASHSLSAHNPSRPDTAQLAPVDAKA